MQIAAFILVLNFFFALCGLLFNFKPTKTVVLIANLLVISLPPTFYLYFSLKTKLYIKTFAWKMINQLRTILKFGSTRLREKSLVIILESYAQLFLPD
jgi:hypothetical protein